MCLIAAVTCCVVEGLCYLWQRRVMHRDIKPSNILLNTQGQVPSEEYCTLILIVYFNSYNSVVAHW